MMLRGIKLDEVIEKEWQLMLLEGYEHSPISNSSLHKRLLNKAYINGGLSTLSTPDKKKID